jgi:hypothetical protein
MQPTTWLGVLLFFLLVAPGFLFDLLSDKRRVMSAESTFREISRSILASTIFSSISVALFTLIGMEATRVVPDFHSLLEQPNEYISKHYRLLIFDLILELILACGSAWIWHRILFWRAGGKAIYQISTWRQVFRRDAPEDHYAYVRIRMDDDTVYMGTVEHYTPDLEIADREIVLSFPIMSKTGTNPPSEVPRNWQRVIIKGASIKVISVEYRRRQQEIRRKNRVILGISAVLATPEKLIQKLKLSDAAVNSDPKTKEKSGNGPDVA